MKNRDDIDEDINPWTRLTSKVVYENLWISVTHQDVIHPSGVKGIYGLVHFKGVAAAVIPIEGEYTWLVGQYRYALNQWSWEVPMGGVLAGEDVELGALRELQEETGMTAQHISHVMSLHTSNSITDERAEIYWASGLTFGVANPDDSEQLKIKKITIKECVAMIDRGEITDAISVAGLLSISRKLFSDHQ
ncbi:NUDIX domain-containing protein [Echinimonas agarilytica]|uniref:GDP-mannose pyrophosphatase n=1 Tax=Echinimonas agarilytica TaxID=1215918 RepID=A0AA41W9D1_9GAMM|nr:NUDIX hydrolase [Echinimonas agarilytica]MCM2680579.1 NUDIX hydrolase [Echinimonas agarilytica]